MKLKKGYSIITAIFMMVVTMFSFVGCNSNIEDKIVVPAHVSFTSETQIGNSDTYYWQYKISDSATGLESDEGWVSFEDQGIGTIDNLIQGKNYWFALRGYASEDCSDLEWEGKTSRSYTLTGRDNFVNVSQTI